MRSAMLLAAFILSLSAHAATVVHGSIYMVMAPATPRYFPQIQKVVKAVAAAGYEAPFELNQLNFRVAVVEGTVVTYHYFLTHDGQNGATCILDVVLSNETSQNKLVDVKATYKCHEWDD